MTRQLLTASEFFTIAERPKQDVPFPEAGNGAVLPVWGMTPTEKTEFEIGFKQGTDEERQTKMIEYRERLVSASCRNDDGSYIFSPDDVKQLGASNGALVERLVDVALELSGINQKDVKAAVKNSEDDQTDA